MKKMIPTLATVTLAGILVSCGASKSTEPGVQDFPTVTPNTQAVADEKAIAPDMATSAVAEVSPVLLQTATGASGTSSGSDASDEGTTNTMTGSRDMNSPMPGMQISGSNTGTAPESEGVQNTGATSLSIPTSPVASSQVMTKVITYVSPAGKEEIEVILTTTDGTISSVVVKPMATHEISKKLQTNFSVNVASSVVGKKIAGLNLDAIGGASLTTKAFNEYIQSL